ncbi:KilA-N domain-containing protein [Aquabacter sp. CN5-332]|uniref:KilA-N domain-containing protein n=1 Tax=Aquabacter sp. CN5-332 TaxID=3156608 RepID=UPI0032B5F3BE
MSIGHYRSSDTYRALERVLKEFGVERHEVEDRRPHPCLRFDYAGAERKVTFACTPSDRRGPTLSAANLRRDMKKWQMEALGRPAPVEIESDAAGREAMPRPVVLAFNGAPIQIDAEALCLTDMWRAAGSDMSKRPVEWLRSKAARDFIEHLEIMVGNSHLLQVEAGRGGATFAHWQIGVAYAKYLSPDFHIWCNTIVRAHMDGRAAAPSGLAPDQSELIRRIDGIARMLSHKVTNIEAALPLMVGQALEAHLAADPRRAVLDYVSVRQMLDDAKALPKGRNRVNRKIGFELRALAAVAAPPVPLRRCPHSAVWLFPIEFASSFMAGRGAALVSDHNAAVMGQGVIDFRAAKRATFQNNHPA